MEGDVNRDLLTRILLYTLLILGALLALGPMM